MHGGIDAGGGDAVPKAFLQEEVGDLATICGVAEGRFDGEGVLFQPFQKLRAVGRNYWQLRIVGMAIDEPSGDQMVPMINDGGALGLAENLRFSTNGPD